MIKFCVQDKKRETRLFSCSWGVGPFGKKPDLSPTPTFCPVHSSIPDMLCGPHDRLCPIGNLDLSVNIVKMGPDSVNADAEMIGNVPVGPSGFQKEEYLFFPVGQTNGILIRYLGMGVRVRS